MGNKFMTRNALKKKLYTETSHMKEQALQLVPVSVWLERALHFHTNVVSLLLGECGELGTERRQVESCNLLVQVLWQQINIIFVALVLLPVLQKVQLTKDLVGEGARHHKGGVACGTAEVAQASRCKHDDAMPIWEDKSINLGLDVVNLDPWEAFKLNHFDLIVKVTNVANNGIILHLLHGFQGDDLEVACGCNKDVNLADNLVDGCHLEALHACLQGTDRVALRNHDTGSRALPH